MNAKDFLAAFKFVQDQKGGGPVRMVGVWRIWPEHGGESLLVQGEADPSEIKRAFSSNSQLQDHQSLGSESAAPSL